MRLSWEFPANLSEFLISVGGWELMPRVSGLKNAPSLTDPPASPSCSLLVTLLALPTLHKSRLPRMLSVYSNVPRSRQRLFSSQGFLKVRRIIGMSSCV